MFDVLLSSKLFDRNFNDADHLDLQEVTLTHEALLSRLDNSADPFWTMLQDEPTSLTLTELRYSNDGGDAVSIAMSGLTEQIDFVALEQALIDGVASGLFEGITISLADTEVLSLTLTDTQMVISSDAFSISMTGALPNSFQEIYDFVMNTNALMSITPDMTQQEYDDLITFFNGFAMTEFEVMDGERTVFRMSETATYVSLDILGANIHLEGSFYEGNLGSYIDAAVQVMSAWADPDDGFISLSEIAGLSLTSATVTDKNDAVLFQASGDFDSVEIGPSHGVGNPEAILVDVVVEGTDDFDSVEVPILPAGYGLQSLTLNMGGEGDRIELFTDDLRFDGGVPTTINGGDGWGWDHLHVEDWSGDMEVLWSDGAVVGRNADTGDFEFSVDFTSIERIDAAAYGGGLFVEGDDNDNYFSLLGARDSFEFDGAGGWDSLSLLDIPVGPDGFGGWVYGFTYSELLSQFSFIEGENGSVEVYTISDSINPFGLFANVETLYLWSEDRSHVIDVYASELTGQDVFAGTEGDDFLLGSGLDDTMTGLGGNDHFEGQGGNDSMLGGAGTDHFYVDPGAHVIDGGDDWDAVEIWDDTSYGIHVDMAAGTLQGVSDFGDTPTIHYTTQISNLEGVKIGGAQQILVESDGSLTLLELLSIPMQMDITGGGGNLTVSLAWAELLDGGEGVTRTIFDESVTLEPLDATGVNFRVMSVPQTEGETAQQVGEWYGVDEVRLLDADTEDSYRISTAQLAGMTVEVTGTEGDDNLEGTSGDDVINGLGGDDEIYGNGGTDTIDGGPGEDWIEAEAGAASIDGGDSDSWNGLGFTDTTSSHVVVRYSDGVNAGTIIGTTDPTDPSATIYTTQIANLEGFNFNVTGHLIFHANNMPGGGNFVDLGALPESFEYWGAVDGWDGIGFRWMDHGDDSPQGYTRAEFEALFTVEQVDLADTTHYVIKHAEGTPNAGEVWGEFKNVQEIQFWGEDSRNWQENVVPSELAGVRNFYGTEFDDDLRGNSLNNVIEAYEGDDYIQTGDGNDSVLAGAGNDYIDMTQGDHTIDGGDGFDIVALYNSVEFSTFDADLGAGYVREFDGPDAVDPIWEASVSEIEGIFIESTGDVQITGDGDYLWLGIGRVPTSLAVDNGNGEGRITFRRTEFENGDRGITRDDFLANIEVVQIDWTGRNFDLVDKSNGETATLRGITSFEFLNTDPTAESDRDRGELTEIATGGNLIEGTPDADTLTGTDGFDIIYGYEGDDSIDGGEGPDGIHGGTGNDTLEGGEGDDIYSVDGRTKDTVIIRDTGGVDTLMMLNYPGTDSGTFEFDPSTGNLIRTTYQGHVTIMEGNDGQQSIEQAYWHGTEGGRTSPIRQIVTDGANFDQLDVIYAGTSGDDLIEAPDIPPTGIGAEWGEIYANSGDDTVILTEQYSYVAFGGDGNDHISVGETTLEGAQAVGHELRGEAGNDTLEGGAVDDWLYGGDGNDSITAGSGSDWVEGGAGDDTIIHTNGTGETDYYDGGEGQDRVVVDLSGMEDPTAFDVEIDLSNTEGFMGVVGSTEGQDDLRNIEEIELSGDVDAFVTGSESDNFIQTGGGNDEVSGGGGDDTINTGAGDDYIDLEPTNNVVDGGEGYDRINFGDGGSEWVVVDFLNGELQGRAGLGDGDEVYYTTTFTNVEEVTWRAGQGAKVIGTGGADEFVLDIPLEYLIIDNGEGSGVLDFSNIRNEDDSRGWNADELMVFTIRPLDATGRNYHVYQDVEGTSTRVAELYGVTEARFLNALDETQVVELPISQFAEVFTLVVEGTPAEDQTLSVDGALLGDVGEITYQWTRDGGDGPVDIDGATGASYTLTQADVGADVTVVVSYGDGKTMTAISAGTPVANVNDEPEWSLSISGDAAVDGVLTADLTGPTDEDGYSEDDLLIQWMRDGEPIEGANGTTYTVAYADIGAVISVEANYTDGEGTEESLLSEPTDTVGLADDATVCDIDMGLHYDLLLTGTTVSVAGTDPAPTFLTQYVSDYVEHSGGYVSSPTGYTMMADVSESEWSGTQEFNIRNFASSVDRAGYGVLLQDFENDGAGDEDYASGNFAGASNWGVYTAASGTTHDSASGTMSDGYADGKLIVGGVMTVELFDTGNAAAENPNAGDDPGVATNLGNDADRGYNKTPVVDDEAGQYLEVLPGDETEGGVLFCFDQGTTVYGFSLNFMGRQDDKRPVYLDIHFSDGTVYRTLTGSNGHQQGGEQYFSYLVDPDESSLSIQAVVFYEPTIVPSFEGETNANLRDIFGIDDLALVVDPTAVTDRDVIDGDTYVSTLGVNTTVEGAVTIDGTVEQGQTLTANTDDLVDVDGLGELSYQWRADGDDIPEATGATLELPQELVGKLISVDVTYTDGRGHEEHVTSPQTDPVANVNDNPDGEVTVSGTTEEGAILTADASAITDIDGMENAELSYQWMRDGTPITLATGSTYRLKQGDVSNGEVNPQITVQVTFTDDQGTEETVESAAVSDVVNVNDNPLGIITVQGTLSEGQELRVNTTRLTDEDGLGELSYQWVRRVDGVDTPITGAESATYTLGAADVDAQLFVRVSYTDDFGQYEERNSLVTGTVGNVNDAVEGSVVIEGTVQEGQTLTANTEGLTDADGMENAEPTFQWMRDGVAVDGATAKTYDLTQADVGSSMTVEVSFTDDRGGEEGVTSTATEPVANLNDEATGAVLIEGTPTEGETLTADTSGIADADGMAGAVFSYQWYAGEDLIVDATGSNLLLTEAHVGQPIAVKVSFTDDLGGSETISSEVTGAVTNTNNSPTGSVVIAGDAIEGETLEVDVTGLNDADGLAEAVYTYQWLRDGAIISGATSATYVVTSDDGDAELTVRVRYTDDNGTAETVVSAATAPVQAYNITGTDGADTLTGNSLANLIEAGAGNDTVTGGGDNDTINAGTGSDVLDGGDGDDEYSVDGRTDDRVTISDSGGTDTLISYYYGGLDFGSYVWDGSTVRRTTSSGHEIVIASFAGAPVIEFVRWVDVYETGVNFGPLKLIVDQADFTSSEVVFAGTDNADTITAPDLSAAGTEAIGGMIFGNGGDDEIIGVNNFQYAVYGGAGNDTITVAPVTDASSASQEATVGQFIDGGAGRDSIVTAGGDDSISGGDGSDTLSGGEGDDVIYGGANDDWLIHTRGGEDIYIGGSGYDFIDIDFTGESGFSYEVNLATASMGVVGSDVNRDLVLEIEGVNITGDIAFNITGSDAANTLKLGGGDDHADGGAGADALEGGAGADTLLGGSGNDYLVGDAGSDSIDGGDGTDYAYYEGTYAYFVGNFADYDGPADVDFVLTEGAGGEVIITRLSDAGEADTLTNVEYFSFTGDTISLAMIHSGATNGSESVGNADSSDNQDLVAGGGSDTVGGGSGSDTIDSGSGNDVVVAGAGDDNIFDALGDDTIDGGEGKDTGHALSGNNTFKEADEETAEDDLTIDDFYSGGYGDDDFKTGGGNDVVIGDRASIYFFGDDTIQGGTGDDILEGSGGRDVFIFRSGDGDDMIGKVDVTSVSGSTYINEVLFTGADFVSGVDKVKLSGFDGITTTAELEAALTTATDYTIVDDGIGNAQFLTPDGSITFIGVSVDDLGADDFIF